MTVSPRDLRRDQTRLRCRAFTLTELLVVIALIALLISLLLAALGQVRHKAKASTTQSTMQSFSNAVESFHQEHGEYPGVVPPAILANDPRISAAENAILQLVGGYLREDEDQDAYDDGAGEIYTFTDAAGAPFRIKVARDRMGDGPIVNRKPHGPYFTPGEREMAVAGGQWDPVGGAAEAVGPRQLPDLIDAWGQPIIYLHRERRVGKLVATASGEKAQFDPAPIFAYTGSSALGAMGKDQRLYTILPYEEDFDSPRYRNFARIIEHPAIADQSRGAFVLISAGADGAYFSKDDGPGTSAAPVLDLDVAPYDSDPKILDEYDDVVSYGGT